MASPEQNVAALKQAFERWQACKGKDTSMWTDLFAPDIHFQSLAAGAPDLEFTRDCHSSKDVERYFAGLAQDWEMINYKTEKFVAEGDRVVMLGSTSWQHRKTRKTFDSPKADLITFRDGRIVKFFEFYDTAAVLHAART